MELIAAVPTAFIVSRLLPIERTERITIEAQAFFLVWRLLALGALAWTSAWATARLLLGVSGVLAVVVPIAHGLGTGAWFWTSAARGLLGDFSIDVCFLVAGAALTWVAARRIDFKH